MNFCIAIESHVESFRTSRGNSISDRQAAQRLLQHREIRAGNITFASGELMRIGHVRYEIQLRVTFSPDALLSQPLRSAGCRNSFYHEDGSARSQNREYVSAHAHVCSPMRMITPSSGCTCGCSERKRRFVNLYWSSRWKGTRFTQQ